MNPDSIKEMRLRSGTVTSDCKITALLYDLMRDHVTPGTIEGIMSGSPKNGDSVVYTNGWLANYAQDVANRLK